MERNVTEDVLRELQVMKQTQEEAREVQRRGIQIELEKVREEVQQVKSRSVMLEEETKSLKTQKQTPKQRSDQNTPVIEKAPGQPSTKSTKERNTTIPPPKKLCPDSCFKLDQECDGKRLDRSHK